MTDLIYLRNFHPFKLAVRKRVSSTPPKDEVENFGESFSKSEIVSSYKALLTALSYL